MKRIIKVSVIAIAAIVMLGTRLVDDPKVFTLKLKDPELSSLWTILEFCKQNLPTSEAKANDVSKATREIIALQELIQAQVKAQTDTAKTDTTKIKPPIKKK